MSYTKRELKKVNEKNDQVNRKDREAYIFLSLFLLVLSFFIVLVAVSHIDDTKAILVFRQLSETLEDFRGLKVLRREIESLAGIRQTEIETLQSIDTDWSSQVPLINQKLDAEKKVFEIDFPYFEIINRNDLTTIRVDREDLLLRTANLLNVYGTQDLRIYVNLTYIGPPLATQKLQAYPEVLALGAMARKLEEESIDAFALTVKRIVSQTAEPFIRFNITFGSRFPKQIALPVNR